MWIEKGVGLLRTCQRSTLYITPLYLLALQKHSV